MKDKILLQMLDSLVSTPLSRTEAIELSLQSLAWAKLSAGDTIPESLRLNATLLSEPARAQDALIQLGQSKDNPWHDAFISGQWLTRLDPMQIRPVLDLALRFSDTGVMQGFDPTDIVAVHPSWPWLPPEIASLLTGLADTGAEDTLYIPWDFGGQLAARLARTGAKVYLETPTQSVVPSLISLLGEKPFQVAYADPIRAPSAVENGKPRLFDVAVASPPFGLRYSPEEVERDWFNRFPERTSSGAVLAVRQLLSHAKRRVVVAVQNSLLFSSGAELSMRQDLLKNGIVQAVVALPSGLLEGANLSFAILVLDPAGGHQQIKFIDADSPRFREPISKAKARLVNLDFLIQHVLDTTLSDDSAIVPVSDVLANNAQLQVNRYVLPDTRKRLQAHLAKAVTVALGDVVTTVRPMPITLTDADRIEAREIGTADIPTYGYISTSGRPIKVDCQIAAKSPQQFLRPLDIVLIVKGSVGKVGIVPPNVPPPGEGGWVAGHSAIVLRGIPGAQIGPQALALQLRSPLGQELIGGIVSGATIQLIQLKELMRLQVLVPDLETAHRAADALEQEAQLQREIDRLRQEQTQATAGLWSLD